MIKFNVILAVCNENGIGYENRLPWKCSEEIKLFKMVTQGSILIIGNKTAKSLPKLNNRILFVITRSPNLLDYSEYNNEITVFNTFESALESANETQRKIFVAGGQELYEYVFYNYRENITVYLSKLRKSYTSDKFFNVSLKEFSVIDFTKFDDFDHYEMIYIPNGEHQYCQLVNDVLSYGERRNSRNGTTISTFAKHLKFDLRNGFPLLTTKKMFLKGIIEELLFFLKGETNSKILEEKKVNIWKGNTSREFLDSIEMTERQEGMMGPMYGYQWRYFNSPYCEETGRPSNSNKGIDQITNVINLLKNDPTSRRILLTDYNPEQSQLGVLYPCHSIIIQFYVQDNNLDTFCYNRSSDIGLGLPFNIASTSLLIMLIAKITKLTPRYLNLTLGDAHIYESHIEPLRDQISRFIYTSPQISFPNIKNISQIENLSYTDFTLENYRYHETIKMEMQA